MIVEDDPLLSIVEQKMVEKLGYIVIGKAISGEEAVEGLKNALQRQDNTPLAWCCKLVKTDCNGAPRNCNFVFANQKNTCVKVFAGS
jgi:hypothetical protein